MRANLSALALALALVTLQTSGCRFCAAHGVHPDLLLLFVLAAGMRAGEVAGALWGIALGFAADTFSAGQPGAAVLTLGALGFAAGALRGRLDCENPNTQSLIAAGATLAQGFAHLALLAVFTDRGGAVGLLLGTVAPAAAANGVLLPAALYLRRAARRWRSRRAVAVAL